MRRSIGQRDAQLLLVEAVLPEEPSIPQLILDMQVCVCLAAWLQVCVWLAAGVQGGMLAGSCSAGLGGCGVCIARGPGGQRWRRLEGGEAGTGPSCNWRPGRMHKRASSRGHEQPALQVRAPDARTKPPGLQLSSAGLALSLQMMVLVGGKERTQSEWAALLAAGGFQLDEVVRVPLPSNADVVVTRPQGA